jgi:hypothetical protein
MDVGCKALGGQIREILPDGTLRFFRPDGKTPIESPNNTSGNLYDDIAGNLSRVKNHTLLDRWTLVDQYSRWIVFVRGGIDVDERVRWTWSR